METPVAYSRGATTAEKLRETKVWVPTPAPRARPQAGLWSGWVREGVAPSRCGGPGYHPRKFCENLYRLTKSCLLVASTLINGLPRTCISEQTRSMSRAKLAQKFQLFCHGCAPGC